MTDARLERRSSADGMIRSALTMDGNRLSHDDFAAWFARQQEDQPLHVHQVPLATLTGWHLDGSPRRLRHESGRFFSIDGLHVETDCGPVPAWDQPIICQPEIGILGIVMRIFDGVQHFLLQAKVEPGNVNGVQLSPTVQATHSNYSRVHGGNATRYLEHFTQPGSTRVLVDQLQGEQGSRFLRKQNRNMVVEIDEDIAIDDRFCWLTLGQIKRLLKKDNVVNMDTRTVLACLPLVDHDHDGDAKRALAWSGGFGGDLARSALERTGAAHTMPEILRWLDDRRTRYDMRLERRPLDALDGWRVTDDGIAHESGQHFSVIGVDVEAGREVTRWQQPLLAHHGHGLNGFVLQRINDVVHLLVRACMYPGNRELFELGSTVSRSNADAHFGRPNAPPFLDLFRDPPDAWVRYAAVQSEEGGRFYRYQNHYMVIEIPPDVPIDVPATHCWMTLAQVESLVAQGYFNIEGRNLIACLDFSDDV